MLRLFATIKKDLLILLRDRSGLALLFLMPLALIIIMSLIQDAPFRDYQELKIPLLLANNDNGDLGKSIADSLNNSKIFSIVDTIISEEEAAKIISAGIYEIGIIIPAGASVALNARVKQFVSAKLVAFGIADTKRKDDTLSHAAAEIHIYFSPSIKKSFRYSVLSSINQISSGIETQTMLDLFNKEFSSNKNDTGKTAEKFIYVKVQSAGKTENENLQLNSVQHNVPAWTVFGMFFIVISLAGSIIKERSDGSYQRILTMPGSYFTVMSGKVSAYLLVCLLQCVLMLAAGIYLLPMFGLPELIIGKNISAIAAAAFCTGLAATGFGILAGTIFNTHQQSSAFGAVSIVILAALGGIWIPVYVMPSSIRILAELSPLHWGLNAFQEIFLRSGTVLSIMTDSFKLLLFFCITIAAAYLVNAAKNR